MVRARFIVQVRYGHFAAYLKVVEQLNEVARARGWSEATFWVHAVGTANELIAEVEYPDLASFEREGAASASDAEWMQLIRSSADMVVQGSGRSELLQTAPQLA
jgi:hypothetical protein